MAGQYNPYDDLNQYPANPYIVPRQTYAQAQAGGNVNVPQGQTQQMPIDYNPAAVNFNQQAQGGGWWTAPKAKVKAGLTGQQWAQKNISPDFLQAMKNIYGAYGQQPQSLAELYQSQMAGQPQLEQMEYNRALARLKGQMGTAQRGFMGGMSAMRGGADSGAFTGGLADIQRQLLQGTGELSTQAFMKNLADQEARQRQLIEYTQGDITNQMNQLQGYGGWMGQMLPYEQFINQYPNQLAAQGSAAGMQRALQEEQINAARRQEAMGWLDRLMGWQGQLGGQYYQGQGQYGDYQGQRGQSILGGYMPNWLPY